MFAEQESIAEDSPQPERWSEAKCRDGSATMLGLFFSEQLDDIARAKTICGTCVVQEACLDAALTRREPWGVWGGQLFFNGKVLAFKRKRGRPRKDSSPSPALPAQAS